MATSTSKSPSLALTRAAPTPCLPVCSLRLCVCVCGCSRSRQPWQARITRRYRWKRHRLQRCTIGTLWQIAVCVCDGPHASAPCVRFVTQASAHTYPRSLARGTGVHTQCGNTHTGAGYPRHPLLRTHQSSPRLHRRGLPPSLPPSSLFPSSSLLSLSPTLTPSLSPSLPYFFLAPLPPATCLCLSLSDPLFPSFSLTPTGRKQPCRRHMLTCTCGHKQVQHQGLRSELCFQASARTGHRITRCFRIFISKCRYCLQVRMPTQSKTLNYTSIPNRHLPMPLLPLGSHA